jgi:hypothetical protein
MRVPGFTIRGVGYPRDGGDWRAGANRFPVTMARARRLLAGAAQTTTDDPRRLAPGYPNGPALSPSYSHEFAHLDNRSHRSRIIRAQLERTPGPS